MLRVSGGGSGLPDLRRRADGEQPFPGTRTLHPVERDHDAGAGAPCGCECSTQRTRAARSESLSAAHRRGSRKGPERFSGTGPLRPRIGSDCTAGRIPVAEAVTPRGERQQSISPVEA